MATPATVAQSCRLFIFDRKTHRKFLVDTGSEVSVLPVSLFKNCPKSHLRLFAANESPIHTFGQQVMKLDLDLRRDFTWPFIIADVPITILGADFLKEFHLAPYLAKSCLIDMSTQRSVKCHQTSIESFGLSTIDNNSPVRALLQKFPDITRPSPVNKVKHSVRHFIETTGEPVHCRARRLAPDRLKCVRKAFEYMLAQGIIRPSNSNYSSPLHMARKGTNDWRPCGDYRLLNFRTKHDRYPIPHLHDFTSNLAGCRVFSSIDLVKSYYQIPMNEADIPKTAVITPFGLFNPALK